MQWLPSNRAQACRDLLLKGNAVLVRVNRVEGSTPRDEDAWMLVGEASAINTIGGGHVELQAIQTARQMLTGFASRNQTVSESIPERQIERRFALGPSLGQCCGGVMHLGFELLQKNTVWFTPGHATESMIPVALFGGGHVGHAIVRALLPLPFSISWIDSRDAIFPEWTAENLNVDHREPIESAVAELNPQSYLLIMSFSHAEDFDLVMHALLARRQRGPSTFPWIGLIGSETKWARFRHRLTERGFSKDEIATIECPIGLTSIDGKEPEVIAASVAAQLLIQSNESRIKARNRISAMR
jgi:xanthine dehydrogenase accessory factor